MDDLRLCSPTTIRSVKTVSTKPSSPPSPGSPSSVLQLFPPTAPRTSSSSSSAPVSRKTLRSAAAAAATTTTATATPGGFVGGVGGTNRVARRCHSEQPPPSIPDPPPGAPRITRRKTRTSVPVDREHRSTDHHRASPTATAKSVRFAPFASVESTISRHDTSLEERGECWLRCHESTTIERRNTARIRATEETDPGCHHPRRPEPATVSKSPPPERRRQQQRRNSFVRPDTVSRSNRAAAAADGIRRNASLGVPGLRTESVSRQLAAVEEFYARLCERDAEEDAFAEVRYESKPV